MQRDSTEIAGILLALQGTHFGGVGTDTNSKSQIHASPRRLQRKSKWGLSADGKPAERSEALHIPPSASNSYDSSAPAGLLLPNALAPSPAPAVFRSKWGRPADNESVNESDFQANFTQKPLEGVGALFSQLAESQLQALPPAAPPSGIWATIPWGSNIDESDEEQAAMVTEAQPAAMSTAVAEFKPASMSTAVAEFKLPEISPLDLDDGQIPETPKAPGALDAFQEKRLESVTNILTQAEHEINWQRRHQSGLAEVSQKSHSGIGYDQSDQIMQRIASASPDGPAEQVEGPPNFTAIVQQGSFAERAYQFGKQGRWGDMIQLFRTMQDAGVEPGADTYNAMILASVEKSEAQRALQLFQVMLQKGVPPDVTTYNNVMIACANLNQHEQALDMYNLMRQQDLDLANHSYGVLVSVLERNNRLLDALEFYEESLDEGIALDSSIYTRLVSACVREKNLPQALEVFQAMWTLGVTPEKLACHTLIKAYMTEKRLEEALGVFEQMKEQNVVPNTLTYNLLITGCAANKEPECALKVFDHMLFTGVMPDFLTYNGAISACAMTNQSDRALELFWMMPIHAVEPDAVTYAAGISAFLVGNELDTAMELFEGMGNIGLVPNKFTCNALITAFGESSQPEKALEVFDAMRQKGVLPTFETYDTLLHACEKGNLTVRGVELFQAMRRQGVTTNTDIYNSVIRICVIGNQPEWALHVFETMVHQGAKPNIISYNHAIEACVIGNNYVRSLELFQAMKLDGIQPNSVTYNFMIVASQRANQPERAMLFYQEQRQHESPQFAYNALISAFMQGNSSEQAGQSAPAPFQPGRQTGVVPDAFAYTASDLSQPGQQQERALPNSFVQQAASGFLQSAPNAFATQAAVVLQQQQQQQQQQHSGSELESSASGVLAPTPLRAEYQPETMPSAVTNEAPGPVQVEQKPGETQASEPIEAAAQFSGVMPNVLAALKPQAVGVSELFFSDASRGAFHSQLMLVLIHNAISISTAILTGLMVASLATFAVLHCHRGTGPAVATPALQPLLFVAS